MNTPQFLVGVPKEFIEGLFSGKYYVHGVMLKSGITHQVVAHLEQVAPLAEFSFKTLLNLPTLNWVSGIAETLWTNHQLKQILDIVQQVQTLAMLDTALLGVNIGINIAGFYLISKKLDRLDQKMVSIDEKLSILIRKQCKDHLKKISILSKDTVCFADSLENDGLNDALDVQVMRILNDLEVELKFLIQDCSRREQDSISLDYVWVVYAAYANLLKGYLTARYLAHKRFRQLQERIKILQDLGELLRSPAILGTLYEQCVDTAERLLTEPEIEDIITLYKVGCCQSMQRVQAQFEILSKTPPENYERWQQQLSSSPEPLIWLPHQVSEQVSGVIYK
ncbi:hypothetical protein H6F86_23805 [Phormidium sp. FACHB-592]|uniref:Uncharacterized protein n=1 Tax=Stenomitos frigidus AS-A4 TaxID=2933935 RepID=A0ABV0KU81_9CYAN|nr:hypothetical protein [Phormidium sp. FACHB-592]MBD2076855.1 hypothetical protein [Phormidium sp. FACHB-592]